MPARCIQDDARDNTDDPGAMIRVAIHECMKPLLVLPPLKALHLAGYQSELFKYTLLMRTIRGLSLYKLYGDSALLDMVGFPGG